MAELLVLPPRQYTVWLWWELRGPDPAPAAVRDAIQLDAARIRRRRARGRARDAAGCLGPGAGGDAAAACAARLPARDAVRPHAGGVPRHRDRRGCTEPKGADPRGAVGATRAADIAAH